MCLRWAFSNCSCAVQAQMGIAVPAGNRRPVVDTEAELDSIRMTDQTARHEATPSVSSSRLARSKRKHKNCKADAAVVKNVAITLF